MDPYMTKYKIIPVILAEVQDRYRFVNNRWWRLVDGHWSQALARESLTQEIHAIMKQVPGHNDQNRRLIRWSGMSYGIGWLITRCRDHLQDTKLPGRPETPTRELDLSWLI